MNRGDAVMTEPDEALLLAKAPTNEQIIALAVYRWRRAGGPPADYSHFVIEVMRECWTEAYRAGAAASDARIKELEAALREVADDLEAEIKARAGNDLPRRVERDLEPVFRARALLKEPDQ